MRLHRRIRGSQANPSKKRFDRPYITTVTEDFWERHLDDLISDTLKLGVARVHGLSDFRDVLHTVFESASPLALGYIQMSGHVNNLVLTKWMPTSHLTSRKVQALTHLHARSLVLLEEILTLTFMGYPSGARALSRTLHEVRVVARFLHRYEALLSERYLASHIVNIWQHKSDFAPRGARKNSKAWKATVSELDERYQSVIAKYGDSMKIENGWAWPRFCRGLGDEKLPRRIPFSRLEEAVGLPYDRERYRTNSQRVHATHLGNIVTIQGRKAGEVLLGPRHYNLAEPAVVAIMDVQDIAESLLRSAGKFIVANDDIYYWLEALDQLSHVLRNMVSNAQFSLDAIFADSPAGEFSD